MLGKLNFRNLKGQFDVEKANFRGLISKIGVMGAGSFGGGKKISVPQKIVKIAKRGDTWWSTNKNFRRHRRGGNIKFTISKKYSSLPHIVNDHSLIHRHMHTFPL